MSTSSSFEKDRAPVASEERAAARPPGWKRKVPRLNVTPDFVPEAKALYLDAAPVHLTATGNKTIGLRLFEVFSPLPKHGQIWDYSRILELPQSAEGMVDYAHRSFPCRAGITARVREGSGAGAVYPQLILMRLVAHRRRAR